MANADVRAKVLTMTVGLPRSGKTTAAAKLSAEYGSPVVCPDAIRLALHGQAFVALAEPYVWAIAKTMVRALFLAGHDDVILDATNTTKARRDEWRSGDWKRAFVIADAGAEECVRRARLAGRDDLVPIIERMAGGYEPVGEDEFSDPSR